jgi:hypothetical protein
MGRRMRVRAKRAGMMRGRTMRMSERTKKKSTWVGFPYLDRMGGRTMGAVGAVKTLSPPPRVMALGHQSTRVVTMSVDDGVSVRCELKIMAFPPRLQSIQRPIIADSAIHSAGLDFS